MTFLPPADQTVYLDYAATTPCDGAVVAAMLPFFSADFGNPSSFYRLGQAGRAAVDRARRQVAAALGCRPGEIIFTSGATEANNLALKGVAWRRRLADPLGEAPHLIVSAIEHHAVLATAAALRRQGFALTIVPCDAAGVVDPAAVAAAIRPATCLISVMLVNNETGAIQPIAAISEAARAAGVPLHTDAVQGVGTLPIKADALGVDFLSLTGHKFHGPKGVGVLYARRGVEFVGQNDGGGQEDGRRGGTENVPLIVGFAAALDLATARSDSERDRLTALRDRLVSTIQAGLPDAQINGPARPEQQAPHILNLTIPGVNNDALLMGLDLLRIAASAGSACTTGRSEPSHVLRAMGRSDAACRASLRLSLGRETTAADIDRAAAALVLLTRRSRGIE